MARIVSLHCLLIICVVATTGCSDAKPQRQIASLQTSLQDKKALLREKESELAAAKEKQGLLRTIFRDTPEVNALQADVAELKKGIKSTQRELREIQSGTFAGWKTPLIWGFVVSLVAVIILVVVSEGVLFGDGELGCAVPAFLIFWLLFSAAIKFVFF